MQRIHAVLLVLLIAGLTRDVPLTPARAEAAPAADMAPATVSQLGQIQLPDGARRSTNKGDLAVFETALRKCEGSGRSQFDKVEVLVWPANATPMRDLPSKLKEAGYVYDTHPAFDAEPGRITTFGAGRPGQDGSLVGMWIETDSKNVLLAWAARRPDGPADKYAGSGFDVLPVRRQGLTPSRIETKIGKPAVVQARRVAKRSGGAIGRNSSGW